MIEEKIVIDGKEYTARSSALIPKLYRAYFGRDLIMDMRGLAKAYKETDEDKMLSLADMEVFEKVSWVMLKHGGSDVGNSLDEWLESLDGVFSLYQSFPKILALWEGNNKTTSFPKKK